MESRRTVGSLFEAFGSSISSLYDTPPLSVERLNSFGVQTRAETSAQRAAAAAHMRFLAVNTAIYWHVLPSLELEGPDFIRDFRKASSFRAVSDGQPLADGRGLILWAMTFADMSGVGSQGRLILAIGKLVPGSDCAQISMHMQTLLSLWLLVDNNSRDKPYPYYQQLLISWPSQPEGSLLTSVRTWLAGKVSDFKRGGALDFADVDQAPDLVTDYAHELGIPRGGKSTAGSLASIMGHGGLAGLVV